MSGAGLLADLLQRGVTLWVENGELCFRAPPGVLTPTVREQLAGHKAEIVALLGEGKKHLVASFAQERLWFLDQLLPGNSFYNILTAVQLRGPLDVAMVERSLNQIIERHETLRTTFASVQGRPVQVVAPAMRITLPLVDLRALPQRDREALARRLAAQASRRSFDLAQGPLLRANLLQVGEQAHVMLLTVHHIVSDGWSSGIFVRELAALYQALVSAVPSPLPELPLQYADFTVWQRRWLQGEVLKAQLAYWERQLDRAPALLELPGDRPRPAMQTSRGAKRSFTLPKTLCQALQELSRSERASLFMTLLAAFKTLLHRYTGQTDLVVGSPIANRNRQEIEGLIGFFVNTLALRTDLSGALTFRELLGRVRQVTLGAYAHQDLPFEMLVERLQPERNLSHSPLFQVVFAFQNAPLAPLALPGLTLSPLDVEGQTAKFDLTLVMTETGHGLRGVLEYNSDLFEAATIERMAGHFQTLLQGIVASPQGPDQTLSALPLLTPAERKRLLAEWRGTRTVYPRDQTIPQLFEAQARRAPDAIAVLLAAEGQGEQALSYRKLNRRANQLARRLQTLGVGPETLVGILMERSLEMVIAHLGVLKAGGAYLPLDPDYPQERLNFMLKDGRTPVLLAQEHLLPRLPEHDAQVICLDTSWGVIAAQSAANVTCQATPDNLAYVMYTSGSTGRPKGVSVVQRGVVRLVQGTGYADLTADQVFLQLAPISFDAATLELWGPLLNGGRLVVMPPHAPSLAEIGRVIERHGVTTLWLTASLFHLMVDERLADLGPLRQLLAGGDVLSIAHVRRVREAFPSVRMINGYGPTENTTFSTTHRVQDPGDVCETVCTTLPIGRPIANSQAYILDAHLQPVPAGVPGELYLGGDGLARGYWSRPALTAEKFVPHPFSPPGGGKEGGGGTRLYKTGDLARFLSGGRIEFLGRMDDQVKLRGFRVELGEVQTVLGQHPGVREAVVLAREDAPGEKRLVGYVVPEDGALDVASLRGFLQNRLPAYMVPAHFVSLDAFPISPNGKVDRRALPAPERAAQTDRYVPPRTPVEEVLAATWAELLRRERVGAHDNFFELGGHSLLATQLVSRLRHQFQTDLPLRALFEEPTLAGLAARLELARRAEQGLPALPLRPVSRDRVLPLSFAQQRLWFLDRWEPGSPFYNVPAAMRLSGPLAVAALGRSLNAIVARHEALRTTFETVDGQPIQVIAPRLRLPLPVVDLAQLPPPEREAEARRLLAKEAQRPFDLARGPLLRASLSRLGRGEHVLLLNMHHVVSDGWSMGVLVRELAAFYAAFSRAATASLPELPLQYADWAVGQREWLQGEVLETQLAYWKERLAGAPATLELPTDRPRPPMQTYHGAVHSFTLSGTLGEALQALSQREGVTLFMTLLAVFKALLHRYTGQGDILVGTPIANRNRREIEGLIGFFANTLALRTGLAGNPSFRALLAQVREVTLGAYAHQDLPFETLVEVLQPQRDLSRSPLFQVMFTLQNAPPEPPALPGLTLNPLEVENQVAKFDLTLSVAVTGVGLSGTLEYNTDLFDAATMARLAGHWQTLLAGVAADPERRLSDLPLLTPSQRRQLLVEWNDTQGAPSPALCLHELFEAQAARTPDALALVCGDRHLSYGELNRRANQLARHLQGWGVGPEVLVGVCIERSIEAIVGLLGVLKAGGTYAPLDPADPPERLALILQDAQAHLLLTQQPLLERLPSLLPTPSPALPGTAHQGKCVTAGASDSLLPLDTGWPIIAQESHANPTGRATPGNLAYAIYTSGSTGAPKGVLVSHAAIARHCDAVRRYYRLAAGDRVLQFAALNFDASLEQIFPPLSAGASLVLRDGEMWSPGEFYRKVSRYGLTVVDLPPAYWRCLVEEWADAPRQGAEGRLRLVVVGGDVLPPSSLYRWQQLPVKPGRLLNAYGPTEATITATAYEVPAWAGADGPPARVPVGRPLAGRQVYVVDRYGDPAPVGVPGELCLGGAGLARGYLRRPALTAERFVPNPFLPAAAGARLYRSGDLARYRPDGNVEFLGRLDHQVKIRGFRIELGEIETLLRQHPQVQESVALVWEDPPGDGRLVAYLLPVAGRRPPAAVTADSPASATLVAELRAYLQQRLPVYMVPSALVALEALPLTPGGKVDRRALPPPEEAGRDLARTTVAPRDALELRLLQIWQELLGVRPIGVRHNFFELGGHSLLAVRLLARIRRDVGPELSLAALFQNPTVERLAALLRREKTATAPFSALLPLQAGHPDQKPLFLVHPAGGNVLCYVDLVRCLGPEQPCYGLQSPGLDDGQTPHTRVEAMAGHYVALLQTVQPQGPYRLGGWSTGGVIAFEMAQQLQAQGQEVALLALIDSHAPQGRRGPEADDLALLGSFAQDLGLPLARMQFDAQRLGRLDAGARLAWVLQEAQRAHVLPSDLELAQVRHLFRVFKNNVQAVARYAPQVYAGAVTLFKAQERANEFDAGLGWGAVAAGGLTKRTIPGNHYTLVREPHVSALADQLQHHLRILEGVEG